MLRFSPKTQVLRRTKLITALAIVLPLLSMIAGAAVAAIQYGAL